MFKYYISLHIRKWYRIFFIHNFTGRIQHVQHSFRTCQGLLHALKKIRKTCYGRIEQTKVQQEGHHILDLQAFFPGKISSESHNQNRSERRYEFH